MELNSNVQLHVEEDVLSRRLPTTQEEFDRRFGFNPENAEFSLWGCVSGASRYCVSNLVQPKRLNSDARLYQHKAEAIRRSHPSIASTSRWDNGVFHLTPIVRAIREYSWDVGRLFDDISMGLSMGMQSSVDAIVMAFVAGLPPIIGLYSSMLALLVYTIFGSSTQSHLGANLCVCFMLRKVVERYSTPYDYNWNYAKPDGLDSVEDQAEKLAEIASTTSTVALVSTLFYVAAYICSIHFPFGYLSEPFVDAFFLGITTRVIVYQMGTNILGIINCQGIDQSWLDCILSISDGAGRVNFLDVALAATTIALLLLCRRPLERLNIRLAFSADFSTIIIASLAFRFLPFGSVFPANKLNYVANWIYLPALPNLKLIPEILPDGLAIAIFAYCYHSRTQRSAEAKSSKLKTKERQETLSFAIISAFSSLLGCMSTSESPTRSRMVIASSTSMGWPTGIASAAVILVICILLPAMLEPIPMSLLAALIISGSLTLCDPAHLVGIVKLWNISPLDWIRWIATFLLALLCGNPSTGLFLSIAFALLTVVLHSQWPRSEILVNLRGANSQCFVEKTFYPIEPIVEEPGVAVVRYLSPVLFHNVQHFKESLLRISDHICGQLVIVGIGTRTSSVKSANALSMLASTPAITLLAPNSEEDQMKKVVVLDCSAISSMDVSGAHALIELFVELEERRTRLLIVALNAIIRRRLALMESYSRIHSSCFLPTIHDAVLTAQQLGSRPGLCVRMSASLNGRDLITLSATHSQHSQLNESQHTADSVSTNGSHHAQTTNPHAISISITSPPVVVYPRSSLPLNSSSATQAKNQEFKLKARKSNS